MLLLDSKQMPHVHETDKDLTQLDSVSPARLRAWVERFAFPRHWEHEREGNERVAAWIHEELHRLGFKTTYQGEWRNVVACSPGAPAHQPVVLIGAHYDGVPGTPGADDNASALAVLLEAARLLAHAGKADEATLARPVVFVAFNREEDGFEGSRDFVEWIERERPFALEMVHVLEMVGYCRREPGTQRIPAGLPIQAPDVGDFLTLLSSGNSNTSSGELLRRGGARLPRLHVVALQTESAEQRMFHDLLRSDHVPFWERDLPAIMWTDTSNFRNPHYHLPTDTPDTLDYDFMAEVTRLLLLAVMRR